MCKKLYAQIVKKFSKLKGNEMKKWRQGVQNS